jgi:hypothetical protein
VATAADPNVITRRFIEGLSGAAEVPVPPPSATIDVGFDGTTCTVDGPATFPAGFLDLGFANGGPTDAGVALVAFSDGATWEELVELVAAGPVTANPPGMTPVQSFNAPAAGERQDIVPIAAGPYGIVCATASETGILVYPGSALTVAP